jgi:hypothetical protein
MMEQDIEFHFLVAVAVVVVGDFSEKIILV